MPIFHRDSFPPGEAKGEAAEAGFIQRSTLFHSQMGGCAAWVAKLATPTGASAFICVLPKIQGHGRLRASPTGAAEIIGLYRPAKRTPSESEP